MQELSLPLCCARKVTHNHNAKISRLPNGVLGIVHMCIEILNFQNCMFQKALHCVLENSLEFMGIFNMHIAVLTMNTVDFPYP